MRKNKDRNARYRRQSRARRQDTARQWRDGILDEESPELERHSREGKDAVPKVTKREGFAGRLIDGTVIEVNRRKYRINCDEGGEFSCQVPSNLDFSQFSNIAVGDRVCFSKDIGQSGLIQKVRARKNQLSRYGPKDRRHKELILAANIDQVLIVFSFNEPKFHAKTLDRYLARLIELDLEPVICVNKYDLMSQMPEEIPYLQSLGYSVAVCSVSSGYGMDKVLDKLRGRKSVCTGPSGVGKSSLIRFFNPALTIKTGEVSEADGTGRHVTTRSNAFCIADDTLLIDTPGLRDMSLLGAGSRDPAAYFIEMKVLAESCRFRDCRHINEDGCAVKDAVAKGKIPRFRYDSFLSITGGD